MNTRNVLLFFARPLFPKVFLTGFLIAFLTILLPVTGRSQNDLLVLEHHGSQVRTFTRGVELNMQTVYNQWFDGMIDDLRHDSVFMNGQAFSYKEIAAIKIGRNNFANTVLSDGMMVAGAGVFVLGAVNGLYRGDSARGWYTASGLVLGSGLLVGGFLLSRTRNRTYKIGKKFTVDYLQIGADRKKQ